MQHEIVNIQSFLYLIWPGLLYISYVLGVFLAFLFVVQILRSPRIPSATIGWLFAIIFAPFIGIPLYLIFGVRKLNSRIKLKSKMNLPDTIDTHHHPINSLLVSLGIPSSNGDNLVSFHKDGETAYHDLLSLLDCAKQTIDISMFMLKNDYVGRAILFHLENKAAQGVRVRLLLDGVGSFFLPKKRLQTLIKNGGRVAWFIPVLHHPLRGRTNLRNHRKIVIADHDKVWTGGRNLAAEYLRPNCSNTCWIDMSFCQQGSSVFTYQAIFEANWHFATNTYSDCMIDYPQSTSNGNSRVQVVPSGPDVADDPIYAAVLTAFYGAKDHIFIITPYYIPDAGVQEALRLAALRGVAVDLVLPGKSNHRLADIARNRYLRELAESGVRIRLIPDTMIHAKVFVVDKTLAMAGSANFDIRSLFLDYEVMNCFYSKHDIDWLIRWIESLSDRSINYHPRPVGIFKEIVEGLVLLIAYQL